ncbi:hypothetical protein [Allorhodopirellula solitaria]|uniref:Uncharacterized protein n=1 Tax=Allorhodopirellula solitaria TaxID=2527987 RepID=A0A5C5YJL5_9BACT|nr:hypothetical protein [Allorhodopirellula solitaria]TWT75083.1 hypothetical protein CA85_03710 [Allorhodopirellula solitaria]
MSPLPPTTFSPTRRSVWKMHVFVSLGFCWLFMAGNFPAFASSPTITVKSSAESVRVAEPFTVQWTVLAPSGATVSFPEVGQQFGDFDLIRSADLFDVPLAGSAEMRSWTRKVVLETLYTGDQQIPAWEIRVRPSSASGAGASPDNAEVVLRSKPLTIHVSSVLEDRGDPTQFRDIESVVDVEIPAEPTNSSLPWLLGGLGVVALIASAGVLVAWRRRGVRPTRWARQEIDVLKASTETADFDRNEAAYRLSKILGEFVQMQYGIDESGHTAEEVLHRLETQQTIDSEIAMEMAQVHELADGAKYAGRDVSKSDLDQAFERASRVVKLLSDTDRR